jgi:hypothetical protein
VRPFQLFAVLRIFLHYGILFMNMQKHVKFISHLITGQKGASIKGEPGLRGYDGEKGDKGETGFVYN